MKHSALHWTAAVICFSVSAVAACTAETPLDASSSGTGSDDVVARGGASGGASGGSVETTKTGLPCDVDKVLKTRCQT
jgi:hypothetical protein